MSSSAKRAALTAMWGGVLLSSGVLVRMHWAGAAGTVGLGVVGTLSILFGVATVPDHASAAGRQSRTSSGPVLHNAERHADEESGGLRRSGVWDGGASTRCRICL
jgi:hypothetical protein